MARNVWGNGVNRWGGAPTTGGSGGGLKPTLVDITKYPTLQDFLASEGKDGNIYLYPNGKTGAESRYYEYMWLADEQRYELIDSLDMDYDNLTKKPSINSVTLEGNKTAKQLGLASPVKVATQMPETGFLPNIMYELGTLQGDTTFLLAAATDNTIANVWTWTFSTGSTTPTITWPQQITMWEAGSVPVIKPNTHYEIRVMDGFAVCFSTDDYVNSTLENLNAYVGADNVPEFNSTTYYSIGSYVKYNGSIWRFTTAHQIGSWTGNDAIETSVFGELQSFVSTDQENVYINVSSSDNQLTVEGLQVSVYFEDTQQTQLLTCDANGDCNISIDKGRVFTLSVPNQSGYYHPASYKLRANVNARYVFFVYETTISGYGTVTVNFAKSGGQVSDMPSLEGKMANLVLSDNTSLSVAISNNTAVFENVPKGLNATIHAPFGVTGWTTPQAVVINTNYDSQSVTMTYTFITGTGIFMVRDDGFETTYEAWDNEDTCVAIHFATNELISAGCDFFIPKVALTTLESEYYRDKAAWQDLVNNSYTLLPNVPIWSSTPYYNGRLATSNMLKDCADKGINSPAADFATSKKFTIANNEKTGYMPTRDQLQVLISNKQYVATCIGVSNPWFFTVNRSWFTSSQKSASEAWMWRCDTDNWIGNKSYNSNNPIVVPVF